MIYGEPVAQIIDEPARIGRALYIYRKVDGGTEVLYSDKRITIREGEATVEPTLRLSPEELQQLANALAKAGYNPSKEYVEGKLEATQSHLADMRQLLKLK